MTEVAMVTLKLKKLSGVVLLLATVPAAIFLAPRIGGWTIAVVLGAGAVAGWLTSCNANGKTAYPQRRQGEEVDSELPMYQDPKYWWMHENDYNT